MRLESDLLSQDIVIGPFELAFDEINGEIDLGEPIEVSTDSRSRIVWKDWLRFVLGGAMYNDPGAEETIRSVYGHVDWKIVLRPSTNTTSYDLFVLGIPR